MFPEVHYLNNTYTIINKCKLDTFPEIRYLNNTHT